MHNALEIKEKLKKYLTVFIHFFIFIQADILEDSLVDKVGSMATEFQFPQ